jgi:hypothetical protein
VSIVERNPVDDFAFFMAQNHVERLSLVGAVGRAGLSNEVLGC